MNRGYGIIQKLPHKSLAGVTGRLVYLAGMTAPNNPELIMLGAAIDDGSCVRIVRRDGTISPTEYDYFGPGFVVRDGDVHAVLPEGDARLTDYTALRALCDEALRAKRALRAKH